MNRVARYVFGISMSGLVACGGSVGGGGGGEDLPESLRVVNAAFDASELKVSLGEDPIQFEVPYGETSGYREVPEGMLDLRIRKEEAVLPAISETLTVVSGQASTYLVTQDVDENLIGTLLTDDLEAPKGGLFNVRFVNAGKNDPVDFHLTLPGDDAEDPATAAAVAFQGASSYLSIDPAELRIHVTEEGATKDLVESGDVQFDAGRIYTVIFVEDEQGGKPFGLIILTDA